jgi:hypothetical protein
MISRGPLPAAAMVVASGLLSACGVRYVEPTLQPPGQVQLGNGQPLALKVHMKSGELYVLDSWRVVDETRTIEGHGTRYTALREKGETAAQHIPMDAIALLETSRARTTYPGGLQTLAVMTTVFGSLAAICVSNPKSCFGSCPTFYAEGDADVPQAEGFSASIARSLEERDVDHLYRVRPTGRDLVLVMRNEALETHAVRSVRILALPRPRGGRVFASPDGRFHLARAALAPTQCDAAEGDCLAAVQAIDHRERTSLADGEDLAARETVDLVFPAVAGARGIVIGARQSLLTTFLLYQTMAYMGHQAGDWLAALERLPPTPPSQAFGLTRVLGGIDVQVTDDGTEWRTVGTFNEAGPLAGDVQVFPLAPSPETAPTRVRLRMAKGNWRLDYVALASLGPEVAPRVIEPRRVDRAGQRDDAALEALRHDRYLVTVPGDAYRLTFALPDRSPEQDFELFLESRGYYYEWMRAEWLAEEDPAMVDLILTRPEDALRQLAPAYKEREGAMEDSFWRSRFRR